MTQILETQITPGPFPSRWSRATVLTHTHTYSGLDHHGGPVKPPENYLRLQAWCSRRGIAAVGMGSPYTPQSAKTYGYYEHDALEEYYRDDFPFKNVMEEGEVQTMLTAAAADPKVSTLFYLDNETPKARYGHMWWLGYHYDAPPWHDYDQPFDRWMCQVQVPGETGDEPVPFQRRPYTLITSIQRQHGALGCWAHPTSWWRDRDGRFITNIAVEAPAQMIADGYLDGFVVVGYHAFRPEYQNVWFALLDMGYRVPGVAEMDCGLSDPRVQGDQPLYLNAIPSLNGSLTREQVIAGFGSGNVVASTGIELDMTVDGKPLGSIVTTSPGQTHEIIITVQPIAGQDILDRVELIGRGGAVLTRFDKFPGGTIKVKVGGLAKIGYLVVRAFGKGDLERAHKKQHQHAVTSPIYLHPAGQGFTAPLKTRLTISAGPNSPDFGSSVQLETADGKSIDSVKSLRDPWTCDVPANGRAIVTRADGHKRILYLINQNPALQARMRHLYRGRFLLDAPSLESGDVPVEHWHLPGFRAAMEAWTLDLGA